MSCRLTSILAAARADDLARAVSRPRADRSAAAARTREPARNASRERLPRLRRYARVRTGSSGSRCSPAARVSMTSPSSTCAAYRSTPKTPILPALRRRSA
jgi:hypothetical protein